MKQQFVKKPIAIITACGALSLFSGGALANATFNSYATISFSVESVSTQAGDLSGLEMYGEFLRSGDGFPLTWTSVSGDASVVDDNPEIAPVTSPIALGSVFTHTFSLNGQVSDGSIDLNQVGWYDLGFTNSALESFDITLNYSYEISSDITGHDGDVGVSIEYYDDAFDVWGIDEVSASSALPELAMANNTFSDQVTFTLDQFNNTRIFYVDVNHSGYLEASPVPLPAAVWPFLAGILGMVGINKRKSITC